MGKAGFRVLLPSSARLQVEVSALNLRFVTPFLASKVALKKKTKRNKQTAEEIVTTNKLPQVLRSFIRIPSHIPFGARTVGWFF